MKNTRPVEDLIVEQLADPKLASLYLNEEAKEGDLRYLLSALRYVVEAQGGIGALAEKTGLSRTTLYKTLSENGNPGFTTLETILAVYGIRINFIPAPAK